jgi:hypothetical protein
VHIIGLGHLALLVIGVMILLMIIFRKEFVQLVRTTLGVLSFFMGSKARHTMKLFFFIKPPLLEVETYEEVISKFRGNRQIMNIHDVLPLVETGDLFTFIGKVEKSYQMAIKWFTASPVSHVGICYKPDDGPPQFIEATRHGFESFDLHDRIHYFAGRYPLIIFRKLHAPRDDEFHTNFEKFIDENKEKEYTPMKTASGLIELMKSAMDLRVPILKYDIFHNKQDLSTLFCSELVAEAYSHVGILDLDDYIPSNEYTPADFSRINENWQWGPERERLDNLNKGAYLGDEIFVHPEVDHEGN